MGRAQQAAPTTALNGDAGGEDRWEGEDDLPEEPETGSQTMKPQRQATPIGFRGMLRQQRRKRGGGIDWGDLFERMLGLPQERAIV